LLGPQFTTLAIRFSKTKSPAATGVPRCKESRLYTPILLSSTLFLK